MGGGGWVGWRCGQGAVVRDIEFGMTRNLSACESSSMSIALLFSLATDFGSLLARLGMIDVALHREKSAGFAKAVFFRSATTRAASPNDSRPLGARVRGATGAPSRASTERRRAAATRSVFGLLLSLRPLATAAVLSWYRFFDIWSWTMFTMVPARPRNPFSQSTTPWYSKLRFQSEKNDVAETSSELNLL